MGLVLRGVYRDSLFFRLPAAETFDDAMRPVLGIELGRARCALVLVDDRRGGGGRARIVSHHVIKYEDTRSLSEDLRRVRLANGLPRRARVVVWPDDGDPGVTRAETSGSDETFSPDVWRLRERLRPLVKAGFRVGSAIAPAQAVAALAALSDPAAVVAGLAVGERAGAMAVAGPDGLLVARELVWKFSAPPAASPLVDRYAFAAQVLPQLRRGIAAARERYAVGVERVILCGSAPALRGLAAPIIEELDIEVETLDGAGGIAFEAEPDEAASAQLAAGAALAPREVSVVPGLGVRRALTPGRVMLGAAAAAAVLLLVLLFWPAPQASRSRRATTGIERTKDAGRLPGHRSAFRGEPDRDPALGETSCARRSASA